MGLQTEFWVTSLVVSPSRAEGVSSIPGLGSQDPTWLLGPWGFSRQEYWSGLLFPSSADLSDPEMEQMSIEIKCHKSSEVGNRKFNQSNEETFRRGEMRSKLSVEG